MNWTNITDAAVNATKSAVVLANVRKLAAAQGAADPLPEMIADVIATLRASISTGNTLDVDTTKIPNSLKGLALRMIVRRLKDYCQMALTADERTQAEEDRSYLNRISDNKLRFELPDSPAGSGEMQHGSELDLISVSRRHATRGNMNGLL